MSRATDPQAAAERAAERLAPAPKGRTRSNPGPTDHQQLVNDLASDLEHGYELADGAATLPDDWKKQIDL